MPRLRLYLERERPLIKSTSQSPSRATHACRLSAAVRLTRAAREARLFTRAWLPPFIAPASLLRSKYKLMEQQLDEGRTRAKAKIPELEASLEALDMLERKQVRTSFEGEPGPCSDALCALRLTLGSCADLPSGASPLPSSRADGRRDGNLLLQLERQCLRASQDSPAEPRGDLDGRQRHGRI